MRIAHKLLATCNRPPLLYVLRPVSPSLALRLTRSRRYIASKPLEKEIVIELPMPKDKWSARADVVRVEVHAKYSENIDFSKIAEMDRTFIEKFNETRTIRIKGKNVDDIDLKTWKLDSAS